MRGLLILLSIIKSKWHILLMTIIKNNSSLHIINLWHRSWLSINFEILLRLSQILILLCQYALNSSHLSLKFHIKISFSSFFYNWGIKHILLATLTWNIDSKWSTMSLIIFISTNTFKRSHTLVWNTSSIGVLIFIID